MRKHSRKVNRVNLAKVFVVTTIFATFSSFVAISITSRANATESNIETTAEIIPETTTIINETLESSALTPEGNMTIVDDIGGTGKVGKQFITVTTKNGNYFYIIIDRDDHGERSVHFLSQVDEEDLLSVLDEETAKKYEKLLKEENSNATLPAPLPTPMETLPTKETKPKVNESSGKMSAISTIIILLIMAGVGGYYWFTKQSNKTSGEDAEPYDQDNDYDDDNINEG